MSYALLFLLLADVVTTLAILKKGGSEANPAMKSLMDRMGVVPALVVSHGLLAAAVVWCPLFSDFFVLGVGLVVYGAVFVNNLNVLRKLD
jgi:hypothetical protein